MSAAYNAAGQMVRSATSDSDVVRWYDGNGRELKRFTSILAEDEIGNHWMKESEKYYIRSSVLGNEVVSEVWSNGRKCKTFVRAAGAEIAWQSAHASETAALSETVFFEYADASGMSQRTSDKNGVVMYGDGGEGSPVESDPMGNNVGTATPYIELLPPREPPQEYPMLISLMDDSPMYVNGQRVSCTLDGMSIGCSQAMSMLGTSTDIDFANSDRSVLGQLGISWIRHEVWDLNAPDPPAGTSSQASGDDIIFVNGYATSYVWYDYYFAPGTWDHTRYFQTVNNGDGSRSLNFRDTSAARSFLDNALKGECGTKIKELINRFAAATGAAGESDLLKLFDSIVDQKIGGLRLNIPGNQNLDDLLNEELKTFFGSTYNPPKSNRFPYGLSVRLPEGQFRIDGRTVQFSREAFVYLHNRSFRPDTGSFVAASLILTDFIHELVHMASSGNRYEHDSDARLLKAVKEMGATSVDAYIQQHCKPK